MGMLIAQGIWPSTNSDAVRTSINCGGRTLFISSRKAATDTVLLIFFSCPQSGRAPGMEKGFRLRDLVSLVKKRAAPPAAAHFASFRPTALDLGCRRSQRRLGLMGHPHHLGHGDEGESALFVLGDQLVGRPHRCAA